MLFVLKNPKFHLFLRALAALIIGPILLYYGNMYSNPVLSILGAGTMIVDGYTLLKSLDVDGDPSREKQRALYCANLTAHPPAE